MSPHGASTRSKNHRSGKRTSNHCNGRPKPGPNLRAVSGGFKLNYDVIAELVHKREDFDKQIQLFGLYGVPHRQVSLHNGNVTIEIGDCIEVDQGKDYSRTSYEGERWFAKVIEIKGEHEDSGNMELFLLCDWFYSSINVQSLRVTVGNLTLCPFSLNEFVLSNHRQVISAESIIRKVDIRFFNELDRNQEPIGKDDFWYRFNLRIRRGIASTRIVLGENGHLPPARCAAETCRVRYKPDEHRQRLCPREGCGFWYHDVCLENLGFRIPKGDIPPSQRLPAMLFGTDECTTWTDTTTGRTHEDLPKRFYDMLREGIGEEEGGDEPIFPLYDLDEGSICNIIYCAQTPIKRGCGAGIVGNEAIVKKARQLLREMWDDRDGDEFALYPHEDDVKLFNDFKRPHRGRLFRCMYCGRVI